MKININKKKTIIAVIIIIAIIAISVIGVIIAKPIIINNKIKDTELKLSKVDVAELEEKLIEALQETKLNVKIDATDNNLLVLTNIGKGVNIEDYITASIVCLKGTNVVGAVEIPCFKINTDNNGNFKNIEYTEYMLDEYGLIKFKICNVFKDNYGVDFTIDIGDYGNKYNKRFNKEIRDGGYTNKGTIYIYDDLFFDGIVERINGYYVKNEASKYKEYRTTTFGLDF